MFIRRDLDGFLSKRMFGGKVLIVYGPRQAGKTTAIEQYLSQMSFAKDVVRFDGEEMSDREALSDASAERLKLLIGKIGRAHV